jgi:hypothetical protein
LLSTNNGAADAANWGRGQQSDSSRAGLPLAAKPTTSTAGAAVDPVAKQKRNRQRPALPRRSAASQWIKKNQLA